MQALVRSGAHNYLECKLMQGHYLYQNGALCAVPASKADVFKVTRPMHLFVSAPFDSALLCHAVGSSNPPCDILALLLPPPS